MFTPNNHSKFEIEWQEINPDLKKKYVRLILNHYDFDDIKEMSIVKEWQLMSNNFKVQSSYKGQDKLVIFRKNILIKNESSLRAIYETICELNNFKAPVPKIILTKNGGICFKDEGFLYQIFEFASGNHFRGTEEELTEIGKNIALIHRALENISVSLKNKIAKKEIILKPWTLNGFKDMLKLVTKNKFRDKKDQLFLKNIDFIIFTATNSDYSVLRENCRVQPIHGDLHPQNTIFENNKLKTMLDFEKVEISELSRDIGNACHRFVRQFVVHQGKPWQDSLLKGINIFFESYETVSCINFSDFTLIPLTIKDELLRKLFFVCGNCYFDDNDKYMTSGEMEKLVELLEEAEAIELAI